jgi:hypothetical protein
LEVDGNEKGAFQVSWKKERSEGLVEKSWLFSPTFGTISIGIKKTDGRDAIRRNFLFDFRRSERGSPFIVGEQSGSKTLYQLKCHSPVPHCTCRQ